MSQAKANVALHETAEVLPHVVDKRMISPTRKRIVISKIAQMLFNYGAKQSFSKGQYIIREGHNDKTVFILLSGEVEILKKDKQGNDQVVTKLSDGGTILGELSIFLDEPRSSSVRISEDALALVFSGNNFLTAVVNTPELSMRILKSLSNKLKSTNERVVQNTVCNASAEKSGKHKVEGTGVEKIWPGP